MDEKPLYSSKADQMSSRVTWKFFCKVTCLFAVTLLGEFFYVKTFKQSYQ